MWGEWALEQPGGERTAVALAYRLALNQVINSVLSTIKTKDLLILDEPTDGFSEQQLDKVRDILHELDVKQLIIVSHERQIESFVDTIIRLKKENAKTVYTH
jgi:exonuclease SbcC